jgi:two-component system, chemotaxis family, response regulator Rcp1
MSDQAIILLADDNPGDVTLTQKALKAAQLPNPVQIVTTGQEVIEYLTGAMHARFSGARIPLLILLDLDLPDLTGFELLEWIRTQESLSEVPVVIYTGSGNASDANRAMHLGANSYWVKPSSFQGLVSLMQLLKSKIGALEINPLRATTVVHSATRKTHSRAPNPRERGDDDRRANGRVAAE